jgi:hypothetical protein
MAQEGDLFQGFFDLFRGKGYDRETAGVMALLASRPERFARSDVPRKVLVELAEAELCKREPQEIAEVAGEGQR